jgi:hypothetical protein
MARQAEQQMSIDELRAQLSSRLRASASFSAAVYCDQPIIMTGRQMRSFVPDDISSARQIARHQDLRHAGTEVIFYEQARYLSKYEDDVAYAGDFLHYYPTYEDMTNEQLRGYFTWRAKVRRGQIEAGPLSFAFVYLYELIHLVGVSDPLEGYTALCAFGNAYRKIDSRIARYFETWHDDFIVYYQLDPTLLHTISFTQQDAAFDVLQTYETRSDTELFASLCTLSSYAIADSPFYLQHEPELHKLIAHVYRVVAQHHDAKLKTSLCTKLFGRIQTEPFCPFARAVFADPLAIQQAEYKISKHDTVYCRNGIWSRTRYACLEAPVAWITKLLTTCESILRDAYDYPNTLDQTITTKYIVAEARRVATSLAEEERRKQANAVHIDFGKLEGIRRAADATCDKLIVEEDVENTVSAIAPHTSQDIEKATVPDAGGLLNAEECEFIEILLARKSVRDFEHAHACMASVLVDTINEKLYDEFADICIDMCDDAPRVIADYEDDVRDMVAAR